MAMQVQQIGVQGHDKACAVECTLLFLRFRTLPVPSPRAIGAQIFVEGIYYMGVSKNSGTPKSSILTGFSIINHPFWGTPIFGNTHIDTFRRYS